MMERCEFEVEPGQTVHVTCSLGFAFFPMTIDRPEWMTWEIVVDLADRCLFAAKRSGRNAWVGLVGTEGLTAEAGVEELGLHLDDLIASGTVQMISSHPPGTPIEWAPRPGV
jgi:two-component system cell cycle response regulator